MVERERKSGREEWVADGESRSGQEGEGRETTYHQDAHSKPSTRFLHTSQPAPSSRAYPRGCSAHKMPSDHKSCHLVRLYVSFFNYFNPYCQPDPGYRTSLLLVFLISPLYHSVKRHPLNLRIHILPKKSYSPQMPYWSTPPPSHFSQSFQPTPPPAIPSAKECPR